MKAKRRIIERIGGGRRYSELTAHPRHDLGKNIADVDFPIVVGYEGKSEIAYNQEELDDILDMITGGPGSRANIPYSLNSLADIEPESIPSGKRIERYAESTIKITKRQLAQIIKEEKQKLQEARRAPDAVWWANAFHAAISDQIGYGEPNPEQRAVILAGLQRVMEEL